MKKVFIIYSSLLIGCCTIRQPIQLNMFQRRPRWTTKGIYTENGKIYVVGMSYKYADERSARDNAEENARLRYRKYLEGETRLKIKENKMTKTTSDLISGRLVITEWFIEQGTNECGERYYRAFCKMCLH